jgi:phosphoglycolate phosphatase
MVGDSVNDITAARAAGMPVLCLTYGYNQGLDLAASSPDRLVGNFYDLPEHVSLAPVD